jgi:hypothetical protein
MEINLRIVLSIVSVHAHSSLFQFFVLGLGLEILKSSPITNSCVKYTNRAPRKSFINKLDQPFPLICQSCPLASAIRARALSNLMACVNSFVPQSSSSSPLESDSFLPSLCGAGSMEVSLPSSLDPSEENFMISSSSSAASSCQDI